jgi:hypothetical protein
MSQLEVDKVIPQSGTTLTLGESGDTVSVPSGATLDASNATLTLPDDSVTTAKIVDANVTTAKLADANVTTAKLAYDPNPFRNRIINGDMVIDQRRAGTSYTSSNANVYTLDRWTTFETGGVSSRFTIEQNAASVTPPTGFTNYMGITSSVASAVTAGMIQSIAQKIEGFNASDLAWGTANAKTVTISFWVRSSLTGTFGGVLSNGAVNYSYPFTYTISAATTWEYKTVTIAGPTAGTWDTTNGAGPVLQFVIGTGSTFNGTAGSWSANGWYGVTGVTDLTATSGATLYITGVQLEAGTTASDFEFLPIDVNLRRCFRYFQDYSQQELRFMVQEGRYADSSGNWTPTWTFPNGDMRTIPTLTYTDAASPANSLKMTVRRADATETNNINLRPFTNRLRNNRVDFNTYNETTGFASQGSVGFAFAKDFKLDAEL